MKITTRRSLVFDIIRRYDLYFGSTPDKQSTIAPTMTHGQVLNWLNIVDLKKITYEDLAQLVPMGWLDHSCDICHKQKEVLVLLEGTDSDSPSICQECLTEAIDIIKLVGV